MNEHSESRHEHLDDHDRGLAFDLRTLSRRRLLAIGGVGVGAAVLAGCGSSDRSSTSSSASPSTTGDSTTTTDGSATTTGVDVATTDAAACVDEIPQETAGPYPGDGSNGANVLTENGVVRSDITSSFGSSTTVADGIPLEFVLTIRDTAACTPLVGAAVYVWHCDAEGRYSLYSEGVTGENFLRGVQETDAAGQVRFTSIFPACYPGRWPHIHFEVFDSLASATAGRNSISTSQLAFPEAVCDDAFADSRYSQSVRNLSQLSLATDNVFRDDGAVHQLATVTGDNSSGYSAALTVGV